MSLTKNNTGVFCKSYLEVAHSALFLSFSFCRTDSPDQPSTERSEMSCGATYLIDSGKLMWARTVPCTSSTMAGADQIEWRRNMSNDKMASLDGLERARTTIDQIRERSSPTIRPAQIYTNLHEQNSNRLAS